MADKDYLEGISADRFDGIIPRRQEVINKAPDTEAKYDYNANVLARNLHPKVQHVKVSDIKEFNGAKVYTLVPDTSKGTSKLAYFRAGHYISLKLKIGDSVLTRPYSLCSSPKMALEGKYQIVVKSMKDGFASEYINSNFKVGTALDISEPAGFFEYEPARDASTVIGLAGGSGIAPFISLASAIADGTEDFNLILLYGSRTEEDILFKDELDELEKSAGGKIKVVHVLSDEQKPGYENGFITAELISKYAPESYSIFVCGSQGMYDYVENEAQKLGLRRKFVRFDAYGQYRLTKRDEEFTNEFKDKTFELTVVTNDGIERKIPARADEPILVAFERAGIEAPSKCRSGECGFCRSKLVSGECYTPGKVERRRQYDKVTGYIHPCCTFPKSDCRILINYEEPKVERKVKDMKKKERMMGLIMTIIISAAMGALASFIVLKTTPQAAAGQPVPMMYITNIVLSIIIGIIISFIIPLGKMGKSLAAKANANPPSMKFTLLNSLPLSIGNTLIIGLILSGFGVFMGRHSAPPEALANMPPFPVMWLSGYAKLLLPTLIVSYVLSVILSPVVSQAIGLSDAGAEVGRASSGKD